jgi:hypothetical protein
MRHAWQALSGAGVVVTAVALRPRRAPAATGRSPSGALCMHNAPPALHGRACIVCTLSPSGPAALGTAVHTGTISPLVQRLAGACKSWRPAADRWRIRPGAERLRRRGCDCSRQRQHTFLLAPQVRWPGQ